METDEVFRCNVYSETLRIKNWKRQCEVRVIMSSNDNRTSLIKGKYHSAGNRTLKRTIWKECFSSCHRTIEYDSDDGSCR